MADDLRALIFETGNPAAPKSLEFSPAVTGWIGLVASGRGLRMLTLPVGSHTAALHAIRRDYPDAALVAADPFLQEVARQVRAYLAGDLREFNVALDLQGYTPFEQAVWTAANRIPWGQTRTYGWIAAQVGGGPGAAQAAGAALGDNPVPLIVPCHRVLGSDGSLHGFAGGLDMKARLLALENGQAAFDWTGEAGE